MESRHQDWSQANGSVICAPWKPNKLKPLAPHSPEVQIEQEITPSQGGVFLALQKVMEWMHVVGWQHCGSSPISSKTTRHKKGRDLTPRPMRLQISLGVVTSIKRFADANDVPAEPWLDS